MKKLFAITFGILALLSIVAARLQQPDDHKLVWISDDNPARRQQIALFNKMESAGKLDTPGVSSPHPEGLKLDPDNSGMEKVIVQSLGGVGSDLFDCYNSNQLAAYVRSGVALDITDA